MKNIFFASILFTVITNSSANCDFKKPNDILDLVKKNHPNISINNSKISVLKKTIEVAKQVPNPELDADSSVGDSIEGSVFSASVSIKHTLELGGKRSSRIDVARNILKTETAISKHKNQVTIIDVVLKLHRLRQVYELIPLYEESLNAFLKILKTIRRRQSLSPEQQVERATLELATSDYRLKISRLKSDRINLSKHLSFYTGTKCIIPLNALPYNVNLSEKFTSKYNYKGHAKLNAAKYALNLAKANLKLENSNAYSNLQIGPTYAFEKVNISNTNTFGIALTIDLPLFNTNKGGKAKATREIQTAKIHLKNVESESKLDLESWIAKYNQFRNSLKTIANKNELEKKHQKIEALFRRGIISTSLVIESHRQLIEFSNTRFDFEQGAVEALWNIYKINGEIGTKKL